MAKGISHLILSFICENEEIIPLVYNTRCVDETECGFLYAQHIATVLVSTTGVPKGVDETEHSSLYAQHIANGIHYSNYHYLKSDFSSSR
jgi:hypothetical protein